MFKKIATGIATASLLATAFAPIAFADEVVISGNGSNSTNSVENTKSCEVGVFQNSKTKANVTVNAKSNTGKNKVSGNTGSGDNSITTGQATTTVTTTVTGGSNEATMPSCCECVGGVDSLKIKDNGNNSSNSISNESASAALAEQKAKVKARVNVTAKAKTGKNKVKNNTGEGNNTVETDDAETEVETTVEGGSNTLNP